MAGPPRIAADVLTSMLVPFWQLVIGACVLVVVLLSVVRLARRGPSRMTSAMVVVGGAVVLLTTIGILLQGR
ncbi:MAG TPA: hypothetical protein VES42_03540 [Pilimelia sp.]|nr:hypothetical protein [Pilimelia sp.]